MLGRNLQSVVPQAKRTRPRDDSGRQIPTYSGIGLKTTARNGESPDSARLKGYGNSLSRAETGLSPLWAQQSEAPKCSVCDFPFEPLQPGQTAHPGCEAA